MIDIVGRGNSLSKTLIILNPISGHGTGARLWPAIQTALRSGGIDYDHAQTSFPREPIAIAERAKRSGYETLIAIGGDGTVNEVVNGLMRASKESPCGTLGVIPIGSGNDFSRTLGLRADWRAAVLRLIAGRPTWIDIGKMVCDAPAPGYDAGAYYFVNAIDTGFGARTAQHAHDFRFLTGMPMYLAAVFKTLVYYSTPYVKIALNDQLIEQRSTMVAMNNGREMGGGFKMAPTASLEDGLLDVIIADGLGRLGILSLLPKVIKGTHIGDPRVKFTQAPRVVIDSPDPLIVEADGEVPFIGAHHLQVEVLPKHVQVIT
jgi:YegS/Rv2252/BmrU family lipid kinase